MIPNPFVSHAAGRRAEFRRVRLLRCLCCSPLLCLLATDLFAASPADACEPHAAQAVSVQGLVERQSAGAKDWESVAPGQHFCNDDRIRVSRNSRAVVLLADHTSLALDQNTTVTFRKVEAEAQSWLELLRGAVFFLSRTRHTLEIKTPFVNAAIESTEFVVRVRDGSTQVSVFEGEVVVTNPSGSVRLGSNESALTAAGGAPRRTAVARPRDAVRWALYYPPVIDLRPGAIPAGSGADTVAAALDAYRRDDTARALHLLETLPTPRRTGDVLALEAGLLLGVGRVDEAESVIDAALRADPRNATAVALQSVIATVGNRKDAAVRLADRAVALDPASPVTYMAQSYARQAGFDLSGAAGAARRAVDADPDNGLAWARLSELTLALGERKRAVAYAQRAARLDPGLGRSQTVLGFALLARNRPLDARGRFDRAVTLSPDSPLARLGLGLSLIRAGELDRGVEQLEIAVTLDPDNALLRSYLGKGYYEQKRPRPAAVEYGIAEQLDPLDPTAYFYDSILLLTINRPVAALRQNLRAQALNDNRAVFRSRLLLDEDLAARSVAQGRIFDELGFEQLGLLGGWKAVNVDPANFSAHRLLADLYGNLPRHDVARVSELMQSQLMQPVNINPIQPQLGVDHLGALRGVGPESLGLNEYMPMFASNGANGQISLMGGTQDTWANDLVAGYVHDNLSFSVGQFHYETSGYRANNQDRQEIGTAFAQFDITPDLSVQAEARYRNRAFGDINQTYDGSYDPDARRDITRESLRGGLRYNPAPGNTLVLSVQHEHWREDKQQSDLIEDSSVRVVDERSSERLLIVERQFASPFEFVTTTEGRIDKRIEGTVVEEASIDRRTMSSFDAESNVFELLYILRAERFDLTAGGGYFSQDADVNVILTNNATINANLAGTAFAEFTGTRTTVTTPALLPATVAALNSTTQMSVAESSKFEDTSMDADSLEQRVRHTMGFAYLDVSPLDDALDLTLGFSYDDLEDSSSTDKAQFNPKLGFIWLPTERLTLRAAVFRTLRRSMIENKTVEPTQVAGFNQFFDDLNGTESTRAGVALDYGFGANLFSGVEFTGRSMKTPTPRIDFDSIDQDERLHRGYVYWTPGSNIAINGEIVYSDYWSDNPLRFENGIVGLRDVFLPVAVRYFHPGGLFAGAQATYVDQIVDMEDGRKQDERFWVFDASVGYRFPKRRGSVMLQTKNLFDTDFRFQDSNFRTPEEAGDLRWIPDRSVFLTLNLVL